MVPLLILLAGALVIAISLRGSRVYASGRPAGARLARKRAGDPLQTRKRLP